MNTPRTGTTAFLAVLGCALLLGACTPPDAGREPETPDLEKRPQTTQPLPELRQPAEMEPARSKSDAVTTFGATAERATLSDQAVQHFARPLANIRMPDRPIDRENYAHFDDNPVKRVVEHPVSTFSIDVDTGSYSNMRRMLREGRLPPKDAVRIEELINYFSYDYPVPDNNDTPFNVNVEQAVTPWNPNTRLLQIGRSEERRV